MRATSSHGIRSVGGGQGGGHSGVGGGGHSGAHHHAAIKWSDASVDSDSPAIRLAELFNVNHIILSQANPYMLPFISRSLRPQAPGLMTRFSSLVTSEIRHRLYQVGVYKCVGVGVGVGVGVS